MKVLVIGKGAREHALVWKIGRSVYVDELFCFPGNAGISKMARIPDVADDSIESLANFAEKNSIDLTVVGPEDYLAKGIVDLFVSKGLKIFGVNREAASLESSKSFAKEIMKAAGIPTASYFSVADFQSGDKILQTSKYPVVLKADGLAAGKGVIICDSYETAKSNLAQMLQGKFKDAGNKVLIEEFLRGEELSLLLLTDGSNVKRFLFSQDHKALLEGDRGANTGGMGAYAPVSFADDEMYEKVCDSIVLPLLSQLKKRRINYRGILYIGLMIVDGAPFVLEYNVRFGDPETEPLMLMLVSDIVPYLWSVANVSPLLPLSSSDQNLPPVFSLDSLPDFIWRSGYGMSVVMASDGYPKAYKKGEKIVGLDSVDENCVVFHAGTAFDKENNIVSDGGRVLAVTSIGDTIEEAIKNSYKNVAKIGFNNARFRRDIAAKEQKRVKNGHKER